MKYLLLVVCCCMLLHSNVFAQPKSEQLSNMFDYEKVLVLEVTAEGNDWNIEVLKVCQGVPTKPIISSDCVQLDFYNFKNKMVYSVCIGNPKHCQIHKQNNSLPLDRNQPTSVTVVVPYDHDCKKVVCSQKQLQKKRATWKKSFDIQEAVQKANASFASNR